MQTAVKQQENLPFKPPFFYGWVMVFISAMGLFFSGPGQTYSVSVFIDSYIQEFQWSRSLISGLYSSGTLLAGLLLFYMGRNIDRFGHRKMMPIIAALFGFALLWMSFVGNPIMIFVGFFLIRLLGQGSMSLVSNTLTPQWFENKRGRALSFASLGGVAGSAVLPPLNNWIIQNYGWQIGWRVWAILMWCVMVPVAYYLVRNRPEDVGLLTDGEKASETTEEEQLKELKENSWTLAQAKSVKAFWFMLYCMFVPAMVNTGLTFHQISILGDQGHSPAVSASVLSIIALVALPCTFLAGYLLDKFKLHYIMGLSFIGQVVAMLLLLKADSLAVAMSFGVLRGVVSGFQVMCFNVMWPDFFGRRYLGSIRGFSMIVTVIGSACGPLPFGFAYDFFGGYTQIIWIMAIFPAIAIITSLLSTKPKHKPDTNMNLAS